MSDAERILRDAIRELDRLPLSKRDYADAIKDWRLEIEEYESMAAEQADHRRRYRNDAGRHPLPAFVCFARHIFLLLERNHYQRFVV